MSDTPKQSYWICDICAHLRGYKYPEGHCGTMCMENCCDCGKESACAPIIDYIKPGDRKAPEGLMD